MASKLMISSYFPEPKSSFLNSLIAERIFVAYLYYYFIIIKEKILLFSILEFLNAIHQLNIFHFRNYRKKYSNFQLTQ